MAQSVVAVYEKGMFKPLEKVHLKEHAKVKLDIKTENLKGAKKTEVFKKKIVELKNRRITKVTRDIFYRNHKNELSCTIKKAVKDEFFTGDLKEISTDFKDVDLEGW